MTPKKLAKFFNNIRVTESGCHTWTGNIDTHGYATFYTGDPGRPTVKAHRFIYEHTHGVVLDPWSAVRHRCGNKVCCNPAHLVIRKDRVFKPDAYINRQRGERPHTWKRGPNRMHKDMNMSFLRMRAQCKFRSEPFELTFDDYLAVWEANWKRRGRTEGSLNITRRDPTGAWSRDNVHLVERRSNLEPWRSKGRLKAIQKSQARKNSLNIDGSGG
jgi:hypothetical protein